MADYYTSTVVQQAIPHADITPLEMFLLENIFENSTNGDVVYFYSPDGTNDTLYLNPAELREALAQSQRDSFLDLSSRKSPARQRNSRR